MVWRDRIPELSELQRKAEHSLDAITATFRETLNKWRR